MSSKIGVKVPEHITGSGVSVKEAVFEKDPTTGLTMLTVAEVRERATENHRLSVPDLSNKQHTLDLLDPRQPRDAKMTQDFF